MKYREPLDTYDRKPEGMVLYLSHNGWHFNKKMYDWAVAQMKSADENGEQKSIKPWTRDEIDGILSRNNVKLKNNVRYDYMYVAAMIKADFFGSSIQNDMQVAKFIKDMVDDVDQADGFLFSRFYCDCVRKGLPIPWEELL